MSSITAPDTRDQPVAETLPPGVELPVTPLSLAAVEEEASVGAGWLRFLRFIELQRRLDAGEPIIRIERP